MWSAKLARGGVLVHLSNTWPTTLSQKKLKLPWVLHQILKNGESGGFHSPPPNIQFGKGLIITLTLWHIDSLSYREFLILRKNLYLILEIFGIWWQEDLILQIDIFFHYILIKTRGLENEREREWPTREIENETKERKRFLY